MVSQSGKPATDQKLVCDFFYEAGDWLSAARVPETGCNQCESADWTHNWNRTWNHGAFKWQRMWGKSQDKITFSQSPSFNSISTNFLKI